MGCGFTLIDYLGVRLVRPPSAAGSQLSSAYVESLMTTALRRGYGLDLRGYNLANVDFSGQSWETLLFGSNSQDAAATHGKTFQGATFKTCWFAGMEFHGVDFDACKFIDCDFRFAVFRRARLGNTRFVGCDMFGATLEAGTVVSGMKFMLSTLPQLGDGITGLEWECFSNKDGIPALVGEDAQAYERFLMRTADDRPGGRASVKDAVKRRLDGVAEGYRRLSGYWSRQAQFADANRSYVRSRRIERTAARPWGSHSRKRPIFWAGLWLADMVCEFGQSLWRVFGALVAVTLLPGFAFVVLGGVHGSHGIGDDLLFSASRLTGSTPSSLTPANVLVEWVGIAQTFLGVALIGLFGFVLGNLLRQS
jgi:uncharacterized protein YjbI with pentapeptide repeats